MSYVKLTRDKRTITLVMEDDFAADNLHVALLSKQWVRLINGGAQLADVAEEPKCTDHERLVAGATAPCFPPADAPKPVQIASVTPDKECYTPRCYVQHIGAYQRDRNYERLYKLMVSVGFHLLRSPRGPDNKYWEIWYLPGLWSLKEPLKGADRKRLLDWLFTNVSPGNVSFDGEAWALSVE